MPGKLQRLYFCCPVNLGMATLASQCQSFLLLLVHVTTYLETDKESGAFVSHAGKMLPNISQKAKLSRRSTNHSLRSKLGEIMKVTGHRYEISQRPIHPSWIERCSNIFTVLYLLSRPPCFLG